MAHLELNPNPLVSITSFSHETFPKSVSQTYIKYKEGKSQEKLREIVARIENPMLCNFYHMPEK